MAFRTRDGLLLGNLLSLSGRDLPKWADRGLFDSDSPLMASTKMPMPSLGGLQP